MTLPIIIMPERHWDVEAKLSLTKALPILSSYGYNTLCFEAPEDLTQKELIATIESTIEVTSEQLRMADALLAKRGMQKKLCEMNYSNLQQLLLLYVSSRHSSEMALWFKELPGHQQKLCLVKSALSMNFNICGIDLENARGNSLFSEEAQANLTKKLSALKDLEGARISCFMKHLLGLQSQGKGVIFVVGQSHYSQLLAEFEKRLSLNEVIAIHPCSSKFLDSSFDDSHLGLDSVFTPAAFLHQKIENDNDTDVFLRNLSQVMQEKTDLYKRIVPTAVVRALNEKTGYRFRAYARPNFFVDCYYDVRASDNTVDVVRHLKQNGVDSNLTLFKGRLSLCVSQVNAPDTAKRICSISPQAAQ